MKAITGYCLNCGRRGPMTNPLICPKCVKAMGDKGRRTK